jgi:hypothetical protein
MRKALPILFTVFAITSLACSISVPDMPSVKVGETQTMEISEPAASGVDPSTVTITMGAGKLDIVGGSEKMIEGTIQYNVVDWKPTVTRAENRVEIQQLNELKNVIPTHDIINKWDLRLGKKPMSLSIEAGAYEGTLDLSGIPITHLDISDGASNAKVQFNQPNPAQMDTLTYKTGASNVELHGLSFANFERMEFSGGAGNYTLDFSGSLQRDATVIVNGGVSETKIILPKGMKSVIDFKGGLTNISTKGTWTSDGPHYESAGEGSTLTMQITIGAGNISLWQQ